MSRSGRRVLSMLLWTWGGTVYFLLEVAWKTFRGEPERISWTMLMVAMLLTVAVERCGAELPWACPLWLQALACAALVTAEELEGIAYTAEGLPEDLAANMAQVLAAAGGGADA